MPHLVGTTVATAVRAAHNGRRMFCTSGITDCELELRASRAVPRKLFASSGLLRAATDLLEQPFMPRKG